MREMIRERQASNVEDKHDLFSSLINANKEESEGISLTEDELMGQWANRINLCYVAETTIRQYFYLFGGRT
jgi:hypothetical protein